MRRTAPWIPAALVAMLPACAPQSTTTPPPATAPAELVKLTGASVLIGAGDIARCDGQGDEQTAALVDSLLQADSVAGVKDAVFTLGDNAYPNGSAQDFSACYGASWGDSLKRIHKVIRPTPGNHEHSVVGAAPYYEYFGDAAGPPRKGYYSYDLGEWHIVVLNTNIDHSATSAQMNWLKADLAANPTSCTLAYWHHPLFNSGASHGNKTSTRPLYQALYDAGAEVVLTSHEHTYERFAPQTATGQADPAFGIRQWVVGTGGAISPEEAFRVVARGGRVVLERAPADARSRLEALRARVLLDESGWIVAVRETS